VDNGVTLRFISDTRRKRSKSFMGSGAGTSSESGDRVHGSGWDGLENYAVAFEVT
jgi:hypothetical protein